MYMSTVFCVKLFVLPFWPGLPGRRDFISQWDYPGKKNNINKYYHVCICDRRNDKQQALLYTAQNVRLNRQWQILKILKDTYRL